VDKVPDHSDLAAIPPRLSIHEYHPWNKENSSRTGGDFTGQKHVGVTFYTDKTVSSHLVVTITEGNKGMNTHCLVW
jgi:hypothetical protein